MFYGVDVSEATIPEDCVTNRGSIVRARRQIVEGEPRETLREQIKVLWALNRNVVYAPDLGDSGELSVGKPPSNIGDDIIRTRGALSSRIVCPNQLKRAIESVPKASNSGRIPNTELYVVAEYKRNREIGGIPTSFFLVKKYCTTERKTPNPTGRMKHRIMFNFFVGAPVRQADGQGVIRDVTHDGVFTEDNPVLPEESNKLAKEHANHCDVQVRKSR